MIFLNINRTKIFYLAIIGLAAVSCRSSVDLTIRSGGAAQNEPPASDERQPISIERIEGRVSDGGARFTLRAIGECTEQGTVALVDAEAYVSSLANGAGTKSILTQPVQADGSFEFSDLLNQGYDDARPTLLVFEACNDYRLRLVSAEGDQHISLATTTIAAGLALDGANPPLGDSWLAVRRDLDALHKQSLATSGGVSTVEGILQSLDLRKAFQTAIGVDAEALLGLAPLVISYDAPAQADEGKNLTAAVRAVHWNPAEVLAYRWELDDVTVSNTPALRYQLGPNLQGERTVRVTIGSGDGKGGIDATKPTRLLVKKLQVRDRLPAEAPSFAIMSDILTAALPVVLTPVVQLVINTESNLSACTSFASMAISESAVPPNSGSFKLACKDAPTQMHPYTLIDKTPGTRRLFLWARNSAGVISSAPQMVEFILDSTPVVVSVIGWPSGESNVVSPSGVVSGADLDSYRFKMGALLAVDCADDAGYSADASIATPLNADITGLADGALRLCLLGKRTSGKVQSPTSATVVDWIKDVDAPVATLTMAPMGINNVTTLDVTVGSIGSATAYRFKVGAQTNTDCALAAGYSVETTIAAVIDSDITGLADGAILLCAVARDAAGNWQPYANATTADWTKDTEAPVATFTAAPTGTNNVTTLGVTVGSTGSATAFRFKVGVQASTDCAVTTGYSVETALPAVIDSDLAGLADGALVLCAVARDAAGNWQPFASATSASWTKDTDAPVAVLSGAPAGVNNETVLDVVIDDNEGVGAYRYKLGLQGSTDCSAEVEYGLERDVLSKVVDDVSAVADGPMRLCVVARDAAGNWQAFNEATFAEWTKDTVAPDSFNITGPDSFVSTLTPTVSWEAAIGASSYLIALDTDSDCVGPFVQQHTGVLTTSLALASLSEGRYHVCVSAEDNAGNVTVAANQGTYDFTIDVTVPVIQVSTFALPRSAGAATVNWTITETNARSTDSAVIEITNDGVAWMTLATPVIGVDGPLNSRAMNTNVVLPSWDVATAQIRIRYTDAAGLDGDGATSLFVMDSTPPIVTSLDINDGDLAASSNYLRVNITAEETDQIVSSMVSHVCLRYLTNSQPTKTDSCWVPITPTRSLSLTNFYFRVGFTPGSYNVYAFVKDAAGNISTLSNAGSGTNDLDRKTIGVFPGAPPKVSRVSATAVAVPDHPPSMVQMQASADSTVYIKWRATDNEGLTATPISLSYTTDGLSFVDISSDLINGSNGGCTINDPGTTWDDEATGCFIWTNASPTSAYYRIRVTAIDSDGMISFAQSDAVNLTNLRFIAGNTETGLGGSARSALFQVEGADSRAHKLVVHPSGKIFVLDKRGLIMVDPSDGVQRLLIPTAGAVSGVGDGGAIEFANLRAPFRLVSTYDNNLLISDFDRIRIVNTSVSPMTIDTLIGGGNQTASGTAARDFQIGSHNFSYSGLVPLPNGDVLFQRRGFYSGSVNGDISIERYVAATGKVISNAIGGESDFTNGQRANLAYCHGRGFGVSVDTSTGDVTKLVLQLAGLPTGHCPTNLPSTNSEYAFSASLNPVTYMADNKNPGPLHTGGPYWRDFYYEYASGLDGNLYAFSIWAAGRTRIFKYNHATELWTILVDRALGECADGVMATSCNMKLHSMFVDAQGKIYLVDSGTIRTLQDDGSMLTLAGQRDSYGEGLATDARFATIGGFDVWDDDGVAKVVLTDDGNYRIREFIIGGDIQTIAGTGTKANPSANTPAVNQTVSFGGDTSNAYLTLDADGNVFTHRQVSVLGVLNRTSGLWSNLATGFISYGPVVLGRSSTNLLVGNFTGSSGRNPEVFEVAIATGVKTKIAEFIGSSGDFCNNGEALIGCIMPYFSSRSASYGGWDSVGQQWYLKRHATGDTRRIVTFKDGTIGTLTTLQNASAGFAYRYNTDKTTNLIYYCGTNGLMYRHDVNQPLANDVEMPFLVPGMRCTWQQGQVLYSATRNSIIFTYLLNNLPGIAEIYTP